MFNDYRFVEAYIVSLVDYRLAALNLNAAMLDAGIEIVYSNSITLYRTKEERIAYVALVDKFAKL